MAKLPGLLDEDYIACYPALAVRAGINQALILQKLHFLVVITERSKTEMNHFAGRWWVYNTYAQWQQVEFPWLSVSTVKRLFLELEREGIVMSWTPVPGQEILYPGMPPVNPKIDDGTKYYTIRYDLWDRWYRASQNDTPPRTKMIRPPSQNRTPPQTKIGRGSSQNDTGSPIYIDSQNLPEPTAEQESTEPPAAVSSTKTKSPSKPKRRKRNADPVPAHLMNPMKDAIAAAFGWSWDGDTPMTPEEMGVVQKAARSLCKAKFAPGEVSALYAFCQKHYDNPGPMALASNVSKFRNGGTNARHTSARRPSDDRRGSRESGQPSAPLAPPIDFPRRERPAALRSSAGDGKRPAVNAGRLPDV